jgi:hypothetical protein
MEVTPATLSLVDFICDIICKKSDSGILVIGSHGVPEGSCGAVSYDNHLGNVPIILNGVTGEGSGSGQDCKSDALTLV